MTDPEDRGSPPRMLQAEDVIPSFGGVGGKPLRTVQKLYAIFLLLDMCLLVVTALGLFSTVSLGNFDPAVRGPLDRAIESANGDEEGREALTVELIKLRERLTQREAMAKNIMTFIMVVSVVGTVISLLIAYFVVSGIVRKYPELREER